ncbi:hypothetical protein RhiirA4_546611 [Rhizophagus irregularis]|uniref:Uncharacterized protein n=1 Tax=Rhizophagus irregularis TaxID=588596 RepID=A0A2I1GY24_9GLOM|nr:hypothetical protein RhiirA4_546611 [Rhizophagus irregularis]
MRLRLEESNSMITDEKERNIITDMEELCIMDKSERNIIIDIEELNISERNIITDMKKQKCEGEDHVYRNRTFVPSVPRTTKNQASPALINFIINLFNNRKLRDHSDPILGYTLSSGWSAFEQGKHELKVSCTATAWIARNKAEILKIVEISGFFFTLNNININGDKSELLIGTLETLQKKLLIRWRRPNGLQADYFNEHKSQIGVHWETLQKKLLIRWRRSNDLQADYFNEHKSQIGVHWNTYWSHIKTISKSNCTSFYTNDQFIHFIKCSNNLLHTVDNLRERNNAYDEMLCPSCAEVEESLSHLAICKEMEQGFNSIERETIFEYKDAALPELKAQIASQLELYLPFGSNSVTNKFASVICVQDPKHIKKATRSAVTGAYDAQYQFSQYSSANLIIDC